MRANRLIGRQVAGRFTIKRFLGEGGMATVFVAEQDREPREVALKIMNEDLTADRSFVKRFQREAKAAARVQHPNSVALIDYGVAEGLSYIAMELLAGDDLYVLLEREGALTQARAARIVVEVCDALMVAHELGIVHRDLKPENIMVIADAAAPSGERVKVLDFGIAKILAPDAVAPVDPRLDPSSAVTRAGTFIGTPAYMSPEQCALLPVDTRADIYTCGVLLFQLVTGRLPFEGQTPLHTATLHIHEPAPRPSSLAPTLDPRLESVIMKALAKKPTERHQTARHLASTLRKILPDLPDVRVAKVGKPAAGTLRARGSTRNSAVQGPPRPAAGSDAAMESAKTMVAPQNGGTPPPPALLRADGSSGPPSDRAADSSPARIRPAAGDGTYRPPAPTGHPTTPKMAPKIPAPSPANPAARRPPPPLPDMDDDDPSSDSDDSMRTLVRAPVDDEPSRMGGPLHTQVIEPTAESMMLAMSLGAPPAPPPPAAALPPVPALLAEPANGPPRAPARPPVPRGVKPTLKSAVEFQPEGGNPPPGPVEPAMVAPRPPSDPPPSIPTAEIPEIATSQVLSGGGVRALGALQLGSAQLGAAPPSKAVPEPPVPPTAPDPVVGGARPNGDRLSAIPQSSQVVISAVAFAETAKVEVLDPSQLGVRDMGTAQTVPLISPATVAAAMAMHPRPGATTLPVVLAPSSPTAPKPQPTLNDGIPPTAAGAAGPPVAMAPAPKPTEPSPLAPVAPVAPLAPPQTPPVYPLAAIEEGAARISGTRGLLIGFLAGALLMGLVALAYLALGRP